MLQDPCPVCNSITHLYDVVDFNKNCEEVRGKFLPISGIPIYYSICSDCKFLFAPYFSSWSDDDFIAKIYNNEYIEIDPDYLDIRPAHNFELLEKYFGQAKTHINHLDYGGGDGSLSLNLIKSGWSSKSYDPFPDMKDQISELGEFNLITAFEVFEHVPNPNLLMQNILKLIQDDGLIMFSTLISDGNLHSNKRLDWWYAAPRNGHISLFSSESLKRLAHKYGFRFASLGVGYHVYFKNFPSWANGLMQK